MIREIPSCTENEIKEAIKKRIRTLSEQGVAARRFRKEENLQKILKLIQKKKKITNDNVQKFLRVSDATAVNCLNILLKRELIKAFGKKKGVFYK